ncbi:MAG: hypothetical protein AAF671_04070 [Pseudomonadota bacterium]
MREATNADQNRPPSFDRFAKIYLAVLLTLISLGLLYYWLSRDEQVAALNSELNANPQLHAYAFRFKVIEIVDRVAVVSSPLQPGLSVVHFVRAVYPTLQAAPIDDPGVMAAQMELSSMQQLAEDLLLSNPGIDTVRWQLDELWYKHNGVFLHTLE